MELTKLKLARVPLSVKLSGSLVNVVELNLVLKEPETMQFGMVADHEVDAGAHERNRKCLLLADCVEKVAPLNCPDIDRGKCNFCTLLREI
ncbi:hypothetical protein ATI02_6191 [Pseudomonas baetica]|uniref:Uncharacterized protein n=1 Tax=Pseudomonas baetica TaxID=674054 RepID=A0ABX4Q8F0_9PSED|nr:hypothetical protein [Pseudomonas baetica]PKA73079.1 hypothetical protein ATI02_6191 [Pseudomonas baetica]